MVLITGKRMVFKQKCEFAPGSQHSSLPGNAHQVLLVQRGSQDQALELFFTPSVSCDVTLGLRQPYMQDLRIARRKTKLMQGTVEGEGVWGITILKGFSCYQMLVCPPLWE